MSFRIGAGRCRRPARRAIRFALLTAVALAGNVRAQVFDAGLAGFSVTIDKDLVVPYRLFTLFVLPGESVRFAAPGIRITSRDGALRDDGGGVWQWTAPASPGARQLQVTAGEQSMLVNALVMHTAAQVDAGVLNGFRIGSYPAPLDGRQAYRAPDGFFELAGPDGDIQLTPHFRLSQFPSKQSQAYPKYLVLRESLLLKLELLLARVNELGISAQTLTVMSGYRTPHYNHVIDNVQYSRHIYGGAADVYIDEAPRDGIMDDLNGDGRLDYRDAQFLYRIADELYSRKEHKQLRGGLGVYRSTSAHGPFIHIDARGARARWGLIP